MLSWPADYNTATKSNVTMPKANWSPERRVAAQHIASVLYGVIAVMTADLAAQPNQLEYLEAGLGIFLAGFAMMMTRFFVKVVTKETEQGAHLSIADFTEVFLGSLWVMLFPMITIALIIMGALVAMEWKDLLDEILYLAW